MAERLPSRVPSGDASARPSGGAGTTTPRWVKVLAVVTLLLLTVFVVLHLTGRQLGGHMPSGAHRMQMSGNVAP